MEKHRITIKNETNKKIIQHFGKYNQSVKLVKRENRKIKLELVCKNNHTRKISWKPKLSECTLCKTNNKKILKINKIKNHIHNKGGILISFNKNVSRLNIECKNNHKWDVSYTNLIHQDTWCPKCFKQERYSNRLEKVNTLIMNNNGNLLKENGEKIVVKCKFNHVWKTTKQIIIANSWCPICSCGTSEQICRSILENMFNTSFEKTRLEALRSTKTNKKLELDGYSKELNLAFEYNGPQHYKPIYGKELLLKVKQNDLMKRKLCKDNKINLLTIKHEKNIGFDIIKKSIINECKKNNINIPNVNIKEKDIDTNRKDKSILIRDILNKSGLKCIDDCIYHTHQKINIKCKNNHIFTRNVSSILYSKKSVCLECKWAHLR